MSGMVPNTVLHTGTHIHLLNTHKIAIRKGLLYPSFIDQETQAQNSQVHAQGVQVVVLADSTALTPLTVGSQGLRRMTDVH